MATETYKVLGQSNPAVNTDTTLYTVPALTSAVVSSVVVCNGAGANVLFSVAVVPSGQTLAAAHAFDKHFLYYDDQIQGNSTTNDTFIATIGATLATGDFIVVRANSTIVSFTAFGTEIT